MPAEMSVLCLCRKVHRYQETATGEREKEAERNDIGKDIFHPTIFIGLS